MPQFTSPQPISPQLTSPRPISQPSDAAIGAAILDLVQARGTAKSICPSEAARRLDPAWQSLMTAVRRVAMGLAAEGLIEILRKGKPVAPGDMKGVIRLRLVNTGAEP